MYKRILVCSDGTGASRDAIETAAAIACAFGSEAMVLEINREGKAIAASERLRPVEPDASQIFQRCHIPLRIIRERCHRAASEVILEASERERADLIVLGCRELRGVSELLLGSVSRSVLHHAKCAVLIARGYNAPCGSEGFENILLASDGSPCAQDAAKFAVQMARRFQTPLTVLNVYEELSAATIPGEGDRLLDEADFELYAKQWLEYVAKPVRDLADEAGVACSFVQECGKPADMIVSFANIHEVDLIVIGSRGLGGYARLMMGSVSDRIAHYANCPVLIVR